MQWRCAHFSCIGQFAVLLSCGFYLPFTAIRLRVRKRGKPMFAWSCYDPSIVGYQTVTTPGAGGSMALSVQFETVDGKDEINIVDLFTVASHKGTPVFGANADQIWKYDPVSGWIKYWWCSTATKLGWVKQTDTSKVTEDTVKTGDTLIFRRGGGSTATTITLSGAVKLFAGETIYTGIKAGSSRFIGYPWPVEFDASTLPKYQTAGAKGTPVFGAHADQIWTYDSAKGWIKYFYRSASSGYCENGKTAAVSIPVPAGQGFIFRRGGGGAEETITFTYPAK